MINREGVGMGMMMSGGSGGRIRASTLMGMEVEMLPESVDEEGADGANAPGTGVETLLVALLGDEAAAALKAKCGVEQFESVEDAAQLLKQAREEGKYAVKLD